MTGWDEARRLARDLGAGAALPVVRLPLADADGATLAGVLVAQVDLPPTDRAAMDGWAVAGEGPWRLVGRALAGTQPPAAGLRPGEALEVGTGSALPAGCDAVLPVELGAAADGVVTPVPTWSPPPRRHVRRRGEECRAGDDLLPAGTPVTPAVLALAAAIGHDALAVRPRPRVAVLVTGDELQHAGLPADAQVRDALGPSLPALVARLGGHVVATAHCGDDPCLLDAALARLAAVQADVLVTCGMAGPGLADGLRTWLATAGARLVVDGVRVRPGHPMLLAALPGGRPLVGLPGNPLAAVAACHTLLAPLLAGLAGAAADRVDRRRLAWDVDEPDTRLLPVRVQPDGSVAPVPFRGAGQLRGLALADALAVVPPGHRDGLVDLLRTT